MAWLLNNSSFAQTSWTDSLSNDRAKNLNGSLYVQTFHLPPFLSLYTRLRSFAHSHISSSDENSSSSFLLSSSSCSSSRSQDRRIKRWKTTSRMRFLSYAVPPVSPRCSRPFQHSRRPPVAPHAQVFHLEDRLASSPPHRPALSLRLRTASETPMDNQRTLDRLLAYRPRFFVYHFYDPFPENQFPKNSRSSEKRHVAKNLDAVRWRRSRCCSVAITFLIDNSVEDRR